MKKVLFVFGLVILSMGALAALSTSDSSSRIKFCRATVGCNASTALAETLTVPYPYAVHTVRVHHNTSTATGTLTINLNSAAGTAYDWIPTNGTNDMADDLNWDFTPNRPLLLGTDDVLNIGWDPGDDTHTSVGLEVLWEAI